MPASVKWFARLCYAAMILTLASYPLNWSAQRIYLHTHPVIYLAGIGTFFAIQGWWIWFVAYRHRNWSRWVSLFYSAFGLLYSISDIGTRFRAGPAAAAAYYFIAVLLVAASALLFTPDAGPWFRSAPDTGQ